MNKSISFITTSSFGMELDSLMPLILEYSKKEKVKIICTNIFSIQKIIEIKFPIISKNKNISIVYLDNIFLLRSFRKIITSNLFLLKLINKIFSKFDNYIELERHINNSKLIFAANYLISKNNNVNDLAYKYSKQSKTIFVGIPLIAWPKWYQDYFFDFDYFLCNSTLEYKDLINKRFKTKLLDLGCPSFNESYLRKYNNKLKSLIKTKKTALFIMVNTKNLLYKGYDDIYKDVSLLINFLEKKNYKCIIKLHPHSQIIDKNKFNKEGISNNYFINESIESISSTLDISISFFSSAILKCVARNIISITYLPKSLINFFSKNHSDKKNLFDKIYFKSNNIKKPRAEDFSHIIQNPEEILFISDADHKVKFNNFLNLFKPNNSILNIVNYFNSKLS